MADRGSVDGDSAGTMPKITKLLPLLAILVSKYIATSPAVLETCLSHAGPDGRALRPRVLVSRGIHPRWLRCNLLQNCSVLLGSWLPVTFLFSHFFLFLTGAWTVHHRDTLLPIIMVNSPRPFPHPTVYYSPFLCSSY